MRRDMAHLRAMQDGQARRSKRKPSLSPWTLRRQALERRRAWDDVSLDLYDDRPVGV
jgi:hypothetical protein